MHAEADRFRPRDGAVSEQPPLQAESSGTPSAFGASYRAPQASTPVPPAQQPGQPQRYAPPTAQHAPPQYGLPQYVAPHYAAPHSAPPHYPGAFDGRDAPLIHPAAAQISNLTPYGVPVYQSPGSPFAPQPSRGLSITALVLGLCSFVFAWVFVVVPIIGIVFGFIALKREPAGKVMAIIGLISSGIGLLLVLLLYLLPLGAFLGAILFTAASP